DAAGAGHLRADDRRQADAAEAEDGNRGTRFHLGGIEHRADAGGHATAQQADLVLRRFLWYLRHGDFRQHRVFGEGRGAHVVIDRLALVAEAGGAVRHQALALSGAHRAAEVGLAGGAELALAALGGIQRDHVVAHRYRGHALADRLDDAATLVAEDAGEDAFGVLAGQGIGVGVANTGGDDAYQHFAGLGRLDVHLDDLQRLVGAEGDGGARFDGHERCPPGWMRQSVVSFTCWVNEPIVETLLLPRDNPKLAEGSRYESLGRSRRVRRRCRVWQLHA